MGCAESKPAAVVATPSQAPPSIANVTKLTSTAFDEKHPPTHWTDAVVLIPHEWLRREMQALQKSLDCLAAECNNPNTKVAPWKVSNFAKWIVSFFSKVVQLHHDNEENIYFPFLLRDHNAQLPQMSQTKETHQALITELGWIEDIALPMIAKEGVDCQDEIQQLVERVPKFIQDLQDHFSQEETSLPGPIVACGITQDQNAACFQQILQLGGLDVLHTELPGIMVAAQEWATPAFYDDFVAKTVSPTMAQLAKDVLIPNYQNIHCALRDSPQMTEPPQWEEIPIDPQLMTVLKEEVKVNQD